MSISKIVILVIFALSTSLIAGNMQSQALVKSAKNDVKSITPKALKKMVDNEDDVYMLDIREPYMIPEGSIDAMENIEIARGLLEFNLPSKIKDKNAFIVVYCRSGKGAVLAAKMIKEQLKYKNVTYLEGGINGWLDAGYSIYNSFGEMSLTK